MEDEVLLSIVILDVKYHYLIPITLESIFQQTDKRFDITVATQNILPKEMNNLRKYSEKIKIIEMDPDIDISEIKNRCTKKANGRYVHFLLPGEYYLSKFSLKYAFGKIERKQYPDIVCFSHLHRDMLSPPHIMHASFSKSFIGGERFPVLSRNVFFLKTAVNEVGGFDHRYKGLEGFDVIVKIHLKEKSRVLCCRRILVDYELQKVNLKKIIEYIIDLILIIYRHYGFWSLFRWAVFKEVIDFFKYWLKGIKRAFMQGE